MTRTEAETLLRSAGLSETVIATTIRDAQAAAYASQTAERDGPGEYGARDERSDRVFGQVFEAHVRRELTQPR
jgi:hypothetical protein